MSKKLLEGVKVVELATFIAAAGAGRDGPAGAARRKSTKNDGQIK